MKILFICTHNRCRSIICEAITNHLSGGKIKAYSAGSQPAGHIHPLSIKFLRQRGIPTSGLISESWDSYSGVDIDVAITVCDSAANEACPLWMGDTEKVHWGLTDPSKLKGEDSEIEAAFMELIDKIESRVGRLLELDVEHLSPASIQTILINIAEDR